MARMSTVVADSQAVFTGPSQITGDAVARYSKTGRIASIDIVRGAVMVLMAIDHVRVYSGLPAGGPTPGIFFTRWITNFCAPAFVFLAGTGAYLYQQKLGGQSARGVLARWLVTRGVWLILLELTVLRFAWTFNFDYAHAGMAGVIWCIGWCMILLAGLIYLPMPAIIGVGAAIVAGHNIVDSHIGQIAARLDTSHWAWFWQIVYFGGVIQVGGLSFGVLYSIVPWVGVMALGYAFGSVMRMDAGRRARFCYSLGGAALVAFAVLRGFDIYGNPRPWNAPPPTAGPAPQSSRGSSATTASAPSGAASPSASPSAPAQAGAAPPTGPQRPPAALRFLNTNKYPASLLFLLMTLGPMLLVIPLLEHARGPVGRVLVIFGRVPFFYYVLHIPLIHLAAVCVSIMVSGQISPWLFANHPMMNPPPPAGYTWSLGRLYLVWVLVMVPLYFACRWYADLKARSKNPLLSYL
jgi:uncharacterized membrane protein